MDAEQDKSKRQYNDDKGNELIEKETPFGLRYCTLNGKEQAESFDKIFCEISGYAKLIINENKALRSIGDTEVLKISQSERIMSLELDIEKSFDAGFDAGIYRGFESAGKEQSKNPIKPIILTFKDFIKNKQRHSLTNDALD